MVGFASLFVTPAAAQTSVHETDEVTIRLVAEAPDAQGLVRAAIVLDLAPGWKTYWIDPGDAGLSPRIAISGDGLAETPTVRFPAPVRFDSGGAASNGYVAPVGFGFTAEVDTPTAGSRLAAEIAVGVCDAVCIPVLASLELALPASGDRAPDPLVDWTFTALPTLEPDAFSARLSADGQTLDIALADKDLSQTADLFAAAPGGWSFGAPGPHRGGTFSVPITARPSGDEPDELSVSLLLVNGEETVEGRDISVDIR